MKHFLKPLLALNLLLISAPSVHATDTLTTAESLDQRIDGYLSQMTVEEKVKMLTRNRSSWSYSGNERLGIPSFTCHDGPHGVRDSKGGFSTAFPTTAARGAAFDRDLSYRLGVAEAREFLAQGWDMRLGNSVDVNRHPLYGRAAESAGEDPFLCAEIGVANILGTQAEGCIGNAKHFILNTREDPAIRKDNQAVIDERSLIEIYGYPFQEAIQRGNVWSIMTAHSRVNGLHSSSNPYVLNTVLRDYFGFRYFVLNDWSSVSDVIQQKEGTAADVFKAGHDLETSTTNYKRTLQQSVESGEVSMQRLDEAVGRVLRVLLLSGRIDGESPGNPRNVGIPAHVELCREGARKSLVLLKNEANHLPLTKGGSIALIGPNAAVMPVDGGSSSTVKPPYTISVLEGMTEVAPNVSLKYHKGCDILSDDRSGFSAAIDLAKAADTVVFVGGLDSTQEGESKDRQSGSSQLPGVQQELINELAKVNPNIVVVVISGGICALDESIENIDSLLYSFYGGQEAGLAIAEVLYGDYNPGGKLPVTMPKTDSQLPPFTDDHHDHIVKVGYRWFDAEGIEPQFAFGHGLSYTTFEYSDLRISASEILAAEGLVVEVDVTNSGDRLGDEVVQLYISDVEASVLMAEKQLKGFERISLEPGETKTVRFQLEADAMAFWDVDRKAWFVEAGQFEVMVGGASDKLPLTADFTVKSDYVMPKAKQVEEKVFVSNQSREAQLRAEADTLLRVEAEESDAASRELELVEVGGDTGGKGLRIRHGDWLAYKNIDLGSWLNFIELRYASKVANGTIELRLGAPDGKLFGLYQIEPTGDWQSWATASIGTSQYSVSGVHDVYIVFIARPGRETVTVCHFNWWEVEGKREANVATSQNVEPYAEGAASQ
jgi:beta-glucosidase